MWTPTAHEKILAATINRNQVRANVPDGGQLRHNNNNINCSTTTTAQQKQRQTRSRILHTKQRDLAIMRHMDATIPLRQPTMIEESVDYRRGGDCDGDGDGDCHEFRHIIDVGGGRVDLAVALAVHFSRHAAATTTTTMVTVVDKNATSLAAGKAYAERTSATIRSGGGGVSSSR